MRPVLVAGYFAMNFGNTFAIKRFAGIVAVVRSIGINVTMQGIAPMIMRVAIAAAAIAASMAVSAAADDYPNRPIRIVVPYPAGGPSDTAARILAEPLGRQLGQRVIVENRPGGAGMIGTEATIRGEHDGYTLLVGGLASMVLIPATKPDDQQPLRGLVPLSQIWYSPQILAARSDLNFHTAGDLVTYAKSHPGKLNFGSAGIGTVTHLAILLLGKEAGIDITHVPYRSTALWLTDALGGRIDAGFGDIKTLLPHIESKVITPLALTVFERSPQIPEVPTVKEVGLPGVYTENWFGIMALRDTPSPVLDRIKRAMDAAQSDPEYAAALQKVGGTAGKVGPEALANVIEADIKRFAPLIRAMGDQVK
jgi:tripartite-type tricarboxylate transporter receptor subunit TctC